MPANKANLYKLSKPNTAPKPKEYDPEKEISDSDRRFMEIYRAHEEFAESDRRKSR